MKWTRFNLKPIMQLKDINRFTLAHRYVEAFTQAGPRPLQQPKRLYSVRD